MVLRSDEDKAFAKLVRAIPGQYCSLQLDRMSYREGKTEAKYQAYTSFHNQLSDGFNTPMEAVDNLIEKIVILAVAQENDK